MTQSLPPAAGPVPGPAAGTVVVPASALRRLLDMRDAIVAVEDVLAGRDRDALSVAPAPRSTAGGRW